MFGPPERQSFPLIVNSGPLTIGGPPESSGDPKKSGHPALTRRSMSHARKLDLTPVRVRRWSIVGADIVAVTTLYWLTQTVQSDFFLFYYLPIFSAAEFLGRRELK